MGITTVFATIKNIDNPKKKIGKKFMVDTGAIYTVLPLTFAKKLDLKPTKTQEFVLADGTTVKRQLSYAMIEIDGEKAPSTVIIGEKNDSPLLGATTLENMGLMVDPFSRRIRPMKLMLS